MRKFIAASLALVLTACATSVVQTYRPRGSDEDAWRISGEFNELSGKVVVKVNGETTIDGRLSLLDGSGELNGAYDGHDMSASCNVVTQGFTRVQQCRIFVDSERAATLTF